jgi:hypothetical protein
MMETRRAEAMGLGGSWLGCEHEDGSEWREKERERERDVNAQK